MNAFMGLAQERHVGCVNLRVNKNDAVATSTDDMTAWVHAALKGKQEACVGLLWLPVSDVLAKGENGMIAVSSARAHGQGQVAEFINAYLLSPRHCPR